MSLTESLLAWITEDEADAYDHYSVHEDGSDVAGAPCILDGQPHPCWRRSRVLAECEAKRQAIEAAWLDHVQIEGEWGDGHSRETLEADNDQPMVVRYLAQPYANRPDFQEDWKE